MIYAWAALESMAARLATQKASDEAIASLRKLFTSFESSHPKEHMDEYSEANIAFHQAIVRLGGCKLIEDMTKNLFIHMRAIRTGDVGPGNGAVELARRHHRRHGQLRRRLRARAARPPPLADRPQDRKRGYSGHRACRRHDLELGNLPRIYGRARHAAAHRRRRLPRSPRPRRRSEERRGGKRGVQEGRNRG